MMGSAGSDTLRASDLLKLIQNPKAGEELLARKAVAEQAEAAAKAAVKDAERANAALALREQAVKAREDDAAGLNAKLDGVAKALAGDRAAFDTAKGATIAELDRQRAEHGAKVESVAGNQEQKRQELNRRQAEIDQASRALDQRAARIAEDEAALKAREAAFAEEQAALETHLRKFRPRA